MTSVSRRRLLTLLSGLGIGGPVFHRAVAAAAQSARPVSPDMIRQAEWIAGIQLTEEQRRSTADALTRAVGNWEALRAVPLENGIAPCLHFNPAPWHSPAADRKSRRRRQMPIPVPPRPEKEADLAFMSVAELGALLRARKVSSVELTRMYLARLKRFDPELQCVVSYTEDLALKQAEEADRQIRSGRYRGPLHGIPWGAKDLIAYPGYPTTWGATPFKNQAFDVKATVAERLEGAGAVLIAKLTLGALAQGDLWFGGQTKSPWNLRVGSSGSSAGSACTTAAGLLGFAIGSETLGSIVSPCTRCGVTGLRPTFGRVSRYGCMALSWSMDKIGPIARTVADCALIFEAIHGRDDRDPTTVDRPFVWPARIDLRKLRVGYIDTPPPAGGQPAPEREELKVLKELGVQLVPIKLPEKYPVGPLFLILSVEAATVFDELTRNGITEGLNTWPATFRQAEFVPAVEYLRANRVRSLLMREMHEVMAQVDLYVGGNDLVLANLTGHPTVVLPNGFREQDGVVTPRSITFTGRLYEETALLAVAHAYQAATGHHKRRPALTSNS